jgi:hypothetical protein
MPAPQGAAVQGSPPDAGTKPSLEERFSHAETLIGFNVGDSVGASSEALEAAALEIERLLREGYTDRKAAYLALAEAYNALAFIPGDASLRNRSRSKEAEAYRELSKLDPDEPKWSFEYAMAHDDKAARLDALLQTIEKAPHHAMARLIAGGLQIEANRVDDGVHNLLLAAHDFSPAEADAHGNDVVNRLNRLGRTSDAEAARAAIAAALRHGSERDTTDDRQ